MQEKKAEEVIGLLSKYQFSLSFEKDLQGQIDYVLRQNGFLFQKEYSFDKLSRIDFFGDGIGIEVKIKGTAKNIYRQCERYCQFDSLDVLILVTNRSMGFPPTLCGKPCYVLNLGRSWL